MKASENRKPPWWVGSVINLSAVALAVVSTWLYRLGVVHETVFKVPRFLGPVRDYFGNTGLYVAIFAMAFLAWWVVILIIGAKLFPDAFAWTGKEVTDHSSQSP
jgi:hypothetical protein